MPQPVSIAPPDRLALTYQQAGALLGVSRMTVWRLVNAGKLRSLVVHDRSRRILRSELDRYVIAQEAAEESARRRVAS